MIGRKLHKADVLNLAAGNSFWCDEVVTHRAGTCLVLEDCEPGDPLVFIDGGYIVKREDISELEPLQVRQHRLAAEITFAGLRGNSKEDCERFAAELAETLK